MRKTYDIAIIGAGVVGSTLAYELSRKRAANSVVIEKNASISGQNQSNRNGGVIHSGLYYPADIEPLKARLCVEGNTLMYRFCETNGLPCRKTGKLILALNEREEHLLEYFLTVGKQNGVKGLQILTSNQAISKEPHLNKIRCALYVPITGSAALVPILETTQKQAVDNGTEFLFNSKVSGIRIDGNGFQIQLKTTEGTQEIRALQIINAAGLYADEIGRMINPDFPYVIDPARGELGYVDYYEISKPFSAVHIYSAPFFYDNQTKLVCTDSINTLISKLKDGTVTKTLGVHVSPRFDLINGSWQWMQKIALGPLKSLTASKDDYTNNLKKPEDFYVKINPLVNGIKSEQIKPLFSGIMAVVAGHTDFIIEKDKKYPNCLHLIGMDSPAWTAALAIAKYCTSILKA